MQGLGQARPNKITTSKFGTMVEYCSQATGF